MAFTDHFKDGKGCLFQTFGVASKVSKAAFDVKLIIKRPFSVIKSRAELICYEMLL